MNKQEFIKKIQELREDGALDLRTVIYFAKQLDEPIREECEIEQVSENESECSNCSHTINHYTFTFDEEYEIPVDGYEFYQVNYCPNCGAKIKSSY